MADPIKTVKAFVADCCKGKAAGIAALRSYLKPDTVWEMVGVGVMNGLEEIIAATNREYEALDMARLQVDFLSIAADGNKVLNERVDRMINAEGKEVRAARISGVFEVEGDKICAIREYFDTAGLYPR